MARERASLDSGRGNLLWAIAVWGSLVGATLLLAKKRGAVIFVFAVGQLLYARAMTKRGVLC